MQVGEEPEDTVGLKSSGRGGKVFKGRRPQQHQQRRDGGSGGGGRGGGGRGGDGAGDEGGGLRRRGASGPKMTVSVRGGGNRSKGGRSTGAGRGKKK